MEERISALIQMSVRVVVCLSSKIKKTSPIRISDGVEMPSLLEPKAEYLEELKSLVD